MKHTGPHTFNMSGEEAADLILTAVYVRRVGVVPADPNLYLTVRHLYGKQSTVIRNVWTQEEKIVPWDNLEFA